MATNANSSWFPLFEFQDYVYQSFLVLPTPEEDSASPGTAVTAKKWAKGVFICGQAFGTSEGYTLNGVLRFESNLEQKPELEVSIKGVGGEGSNPASFEGTGIGRDGVTKGAVYALVGWAFRDEKQTGPGGSIKRVCGSVRFVRGPDAKPDIDLSGLPLGTVGSFVIISIGSA